MATVTRTIHADRQRVFAVLADGWAYSNWVVGSSHVRAVEANWPEPGSRLFHASGAWPVVTRDETQVLAGETNAKLVLKARGWPVGEAEIKIAVMGEGSACTVKMSETPCAGPGRWLHNPATEAALVRRNTEALARLAAIAEQRVTPAD